MGDLDRSAYVHLKIIKLKLSTEVKYRDIRVKKCIRANDALNDFEYSDTLWTTPATIRYRKAHLLHDYLKMIIMMTTVHFLHRVIRVP